MLRRGREVAEGRRRRARDGIPPSRQRGGAGSGGEAPAPSGRQSPQPAAEGRRPRGGSPPSHLPALSAQRAAAAVALCMCACVAGGDLQASVKASLVASRRSSDERVGGQGIATRRRVHCLGRLRGIGHWEPCRVQQPQLHQDSGLVPVDALRLQLRVSWGGGQRQASHVWAAASVMSRACAWRRSTPLNTAHPRSVMGHLRDPGIRDRIGPAGAGHPRPPTLSPSNFTTAMKGTRTRFPVGATPAKVKKSSRPARVTSRAGRLVAASAVRAGQEGGRAARDPAPCSPHPRSTAPTRVHLEASSPWVCCG